MHPPAEDRPRAGVGEQLKCSNARLLLADRVELALLLSHLGLLQKQLPGAPSANILALLQPAQHARRELVRLVGAAARQHKRAPNAHRGKLGRVLPPFEEPLTLHRSLGEEAPRVERSALQPQLGGAQRHESAPRRSLVLALQPLQPSDVQLPRAERHPTAHVVESLQRAQRIVRGPRHLRKHVVAQRLFSQPSLEHRLRPRRRREVPGSEPLCQRLAHAALQHSVSRHNAEALLALRQTQTPSEEEPGAVRFFERHDQPSRAAQDEDLEAERELD
mmetsp:Transcript_14279/g.50835  ORF Transcript_14279/g.50835 Transcript_14279/m.50835 type:complete len:276 (-) Transcript_14279:498-1325(-)